MKKILLSFIFLSTYVLQNLWATNITVTSKDDNGTGTLRQAIIDASSGDSIVFDSNLSAQTITLASSLDINKTLTIETNSSISIIIDGNFSVRPFTLSNATLNIKNITIKNGHAVYDGNNSSSKNGGAIYVDNLSVLNVDGVHFTSNSTDSNGSGYGGAIETFGQTNISNSSFVSNTAPSGEAGAISNFGTLNITNTTFSGNSAGNAGAIRLQGGSGSVTKIDSSTFADNNTSGLGGALRLINTGINTTIKNSVFYNNSAATGATCNSDVNTSAGDISSAGFNFIDDITGCTALGSALSSDTFGISLNPELGTLIKDSDGITWAYTLESNSTLINNGSCINIDGNTTAQDQFGNTRPLGLTCDIGAIENTSTPTITSTPDTNATEDETYIYNLIASDIDDTNLTWSVTSGSSLPSWLSLNTEGNITENNSSNPMSSFNISDNYPIPEFVDFDGDGDLDVIAGNNNNGIFYYENNGTSKDPSFVVGLDPLSGITKGAYTNFRFVDIDKDNDLDLFVAFQNDNDIKYYENNGTSTSPSFNTATPTTTYTFSSNNGYWYFTLEDIDKDGDYDMVVVPYSLHAITYYENTGTVASPTFTQKISVDNPFDTISEGTYPTVAFFDSDFDNDLDLIVGRSDGNVSYYENNGSLFFIKKTGTDNPFDGVDVGDYFIPDFGDIDGDGDKDLLVGTNGSDFRYFENNLGVKLIGTPSLSDEGVYDINITVTDPGGLSDKQEFQLTVNTQSRVYINLSNYNANEHNITAITLIGVDGLDNNIVMSTSNDINWSGIINVDGNYSFKFETNDSTKWYVNFSDNKLYLDTNGSSDFKTSLIQASAPLYANLDLNSSNWENRVPSIIDNITYTQITLAGDGVTNTNAVNSTEANNTAISQILWDVKADELEAVYVAEYNANQVFGVSPTNILKVAHTGTTSPVGYIPYSDNFYYALYSDGYIYKVNMSNDTSELVLKAKDSSTTSGNVISTSIYSFEMYNNYYYIGTNNGHIYKINKDTNVSSIVVSTGVSFIHDIEFDSDGTLYFAEGSNHKVKKFESNTTTIVAGTGVQSSTGDGGLATNATISSPYGISFDKDDNLYILENTGNRLRKVDNKGIISTISTTGLSNPYGLDVDDKYNIYIGDRNELIKLDATALYNIEVDENNGSIIISTIANDDDGDTLTYSISGVDSSFFDINSTTGEIKFITAPDFENPDDNGSDNTYNFDLIVSDGESTTIQSVSVIVTDVDDTSTLVLSQSSYDFGKVLLNKNETITISLGNSGVNAITGISPSISNGSNYSINTNCSSTLNSMADCDINITVNLQSTGLQTATLTISSSDIASPHTVDINATGYDPGVGDLDISFGNDGITNAGVSYASAIEVSDILTLENGGVILVGTGRVSSVIDGLLLKYDSNGSLNQSFGGGGISLVYDTTLNSAYLDDNDSIILAGSYDNNGTQELRLVKFLSDGNQDFTFGTSGYVSHVEGEQESAAADMVVLSNEKLVVITRAIVDEGGNDKYYLRLMAFDQNGTRDTSFGTDDNVTYSANISGSSVDFEPKALAVDHNDNIFVGANFQGSSSTNDILILKYTSTGDLDSSFGNDGNVTIDINSTQEYITDIVLQNDGKILISGYYDDIVSQENHMIIRLDTNGSLDTTFGDGGYKIIDVNGSNNLDFANTLKVQNDGKILLAGYDKESTTDYRMTLLRLNSNGSLDTTFGDNGFSFAESSTFDNSHADVIALPSSDKILIAGGENDNGDILLAQFYNNDTNTSNNSEDLNITISNYNTSIHNITNISYVGANGNSIYEDINGSSSLSNGDNNLSLNVSDSNADFSLQIQIDNNTTYWYNFDDGNLYSEHNLSNSFITNISDLNGSLNIDLNSVTINSINLPNSYTEILSEFSKNIYNLNSNNEIEMEARSDVDSDYYDNNISGIIMPQNPANMIRFEHRKDSNDSNKTEFRYSYVKFSSTTDANGTWEYTEVQFEDNNESNESENGTFSKDINNIITITEVNATQASEEFKFGELLDYTDLNSIISSEFTDINFTSEDKGVIVYFKNLITEVETHGQRVEKRDQNGSVVGYYTSFSDFISTHVTNNSWFSCVSDNNCSQGLSFSSDTNSSDTNGTLIVNGNDSNGSKVILANAGTWKIENDILYLFPTVSVEHDNLYKLENGYIHYANEDKAGEVDADIWFNPRAARKLVQYFGGVYNNYTGYSKDWTYVIDNEPSFDNNFSDQIVSEDSGNLDINISATDVDGDDINYSVTISNSSIVSYSLNSDILTISPLANASGLVTVEVNASSTSFSISEDFNVTINSVNDIPIANDDNKTTAEDTSIIIDVLSNDSDIDGDTLTIVSVSTPSNGSAVIVGNDINYTPNTNFNGSDSFTYTISDGNLSDNATVNINVSNTNDTPSITSSSSVNVIENTTSVITVTATDNDGDTLSYSITGGADQSFFNIDSSSGVLSFNNAPDYENPQDGNTNNVYRVQVTVTDGSSSDTQSMSVAVKDEAVETTTKTLLASSWDQGDHNATYQSNSIIDNSSYASLTVNKIANGKSILELSQDNLGSMIESSADINLSNIDNTTTITLILSDDSNYSTRLSITSQEAIASVYNGNTLESNSSIFDQDTSNYFSQKRVKLNTWFLNNKIYFNVTDINNNQLGKIVQFPNSSMSSFTKHTLEISLNDTSSASQSSVSVDFYGITSSANISYSYYKRLPYLEFKIDNSIYNSASAIDINQSNWFQIETRSDESNYIYTKVGRINPINTYVLEEDLRINHKNIITKEEKQKTDLNITNNLIRFDDDNDSIMDEEVKYISEVNLSTINTKLSLAGFNSSLSGSAKGYKLYNKKLITSCELHYSDTSISYSDKSDFIVHYTQGNSNNNYLMTNRFNNLKVLQFGSTTNELVEYDLNTSTITTIGTYNEVNNVSCIDKTSNSNTIVTIPTLFDINTTVDGYVSTIGLNSSNNKVHTKYQKENDTHEMYFFNEEAAKQLTENLGITKTPTKEVDINSTTWNYVSLSSNITLCNAEFQSVLTSVCNQDYTIEEVFSNVDTVLKYTGYWSYWDNNSSNPYNVDKLSSINNKEGLLINTDSATTLNLPYNLFDKIETDVMDLYQSGWFLTSVPMNHTIGHLEDMVNSQGKTLKYVLYLDKDSNVSDTNESSPWNIYAPQDDNLVNTKYPRLDSIKSDESFWLYVE